MFNISWSLNCLCICSLYESTLIDWTCLDTTTCWGQAYVCLELHPGSWQYLTLLYSYGICNCFPNICKETLRTICRCRVPLPLKETGGGSSWVQRCISAFLFVYDCLRCLRGSGIICYTTTTTNTLRGLYWCLCSYVFWCASSLILLVCLHFVWVCADVRVFTFIFLWFFVEFDVDTDIESLSLFRSWFLGYGFL